MSSRSVSDIQTRAEKNVTHIVIDTDETGLCMKPKSSNHRSAMIVQKSCQNYANKLLCLSSIINKSVNLGIKILRISDYAR
jgi:hypothetical protein